MRILSFVGHQRNGLAATISAKLVATVVSSGKLCCRQSQDIRCLTTRSQGAPTTSEEKYYLATIRLYRILQRVCRSFPVENENDLILIQPALEARDWGKHLIYTPPSPTTVEELFRLFYVMTDDSEHALVGETTSSIEDWFEQVVDKATAAELPPMTAMTCWTSARQLQSAIKTAFRVTSRSAFESASNPHTWAIRAVQLLQEQQLMWKNSSSTTTQGIRVTATSRCIGKTSPTAVSSLSPTELAAILESKFRFAYRIRVENVSDQSVQLLGRYWCIQEMTVDGKVDDSKEDVVVDSPATGAVGQLPVLRPGQVFEYMSGTDLVSTRGVMQGHFYMAKVPHNTISGKSGDHVAGLTANAQEKFQVEVAPFPLDAGNK